MKKSKTQYKNPKDEIPYFLIKWARKPSWTLIEAIHLFAEKDPDLQPSIRPDESKPDTFNGLFYWLERRVNKGELTPTSQTADFPITAQKFIPGSIYRAVKERGKFPIGSTTTVAVEHLHAHHSIKYQGAITYSVYREAARVLFLKHPEATIENVALHLHDLPKIFNSPERGNIKKEAITTLQTWFKNLNPNPDKGKLSAKEKEKAEILTPIAEVIDFI
tara:strand:+ start:1922 stop:2578 length:657 start_codon:yes stop_codon:yes gene_type:complete